LKSEAVVPRAIANCPRVGIGVSQKPCFADKFHLLFHLALGLGG
jgi:hypothetical protein